MLTKKRIDELLKNLPPDGQKYAKDVRSSPPFRQVQSTAYSNACVLQSDKMKRGIPGESQSLEWRFAWHLEYDPETHEYWAQPKKILLVYKSKDGKRTVKPWHTPDYLVIDDDGIWLIECKTEEDLREACR